MVKITEMAALNGPRSGQQRMGPPRIKSFYFYLSIGIWMVRVECNERANLLSLVVVPLPVASGVLVEEG